MTKIPEAAKLSELSDANQNMRSAMAPPPPAPVTGVKRKTLVEQAVEFVRPAPAPPSLKAPSVKSGSIPSLSRQASASAISRPASSSSTRTTSSGSVYSQSIGSSRIGSTQSLRPTSSMSSYGNTSKTTKPGHRPAASLDAQSEGRNSQGNGSNIYSMQLFSFSDSSEQHFQQNGSRDQFIQHDWSGSAVNSLNVVKRRAKSARNLRETCISTGLQQLSLNDRRASQEFKDENGNEYSIPKTPSQIPRKKKTAAATPTRLCKTPSPTKSSRKRLPPVGGFLTKDSNIKCADWDVNDRLDKMETMYADMRAALDGSTGERDTLKETLALLKSRSR
jgi:hypothetical protein